MNLLLTFLHYYVSYNTSPNINLYNKQIYNPIEISETINKKDIDISIIEKKGNDNNNEDFVWFKDDLFSYRNILYSKYNKEYNLIEYSEEIDIEDRDEIDVDKVYEKYINRNIFEYREEKSFYIYNKELKYWEIKKDNIKNKEIEYIIFYFHWMWWNRHQWINDETFWWNFNRIQNLMIKNNWIYISNDFSDFYDRWSEEMLFLIKEKKKQYPNSKIILSWASSWGTLLWNIIKKDSSLINGIILMWSVVDKHIENIIKYNKIPIYISHWTKDSQIRYEWKEDFYKYIKSIDNNYPILIDIFQDWVHWTPIRMTDWKRAINFIIKKE